MADEVDQSALVNEFSSLTGAPEAVVSLRIVLPCQDN
jgi:hypothetical protein